MAGTKNTAKAGLTRRGFLAGCGVAVAATSIPGAALASQAPAGAALEPLRAAYLRRVEKLALELRPRFVSGELHGFNDADAAADEAAHRRGARGWRAPIHRLEKEVETTHVPTFSDAYVVLACSPSEGLLDGGTAIADARNVAAEAMTLDVLRIARRRGWYEPDPSEEPSREQLGA